jgi:predicted component of type VI protein secretion system
VFVRLLLKNSRQIGGSVRVEKSPFVIGRHADCDLRVNSPRVSVFHCSILLKDGVPFVKAWSARTARV